jgi:putative ABC transport system permease protein
MFPVLFKIFIRVVGQNGRIYVLKFLPLVIAFVVSLPILLFLRHEFTFDHFHTDYRAISRIIQVNEQSLFFHNRYNANIDEALFAAITETQNSLVASRVVPAGHLAVIHNHTLVEEPAQLVDANLPAIFTFVLTEGSLQTFANEKGTVLLSSSLAQKYFNGHAAGKQLRIRTLNDTVSFLVAGVFQDFPTNAHRSFSIVIKNDSTALSQLNFSMAHANVYVKSSQPREELEKRLASLSGTVAELRLQPLDEIYFGSRMLGDVSRHGDYESILILGLILFLILFSATTNYVNLASLSLPTRSVELGFRQVIGASRSSLLLQFVVESILLCGSAFLAAVMLLILFRHQVASLFAIDFVSILRQSPWTLVSVVLSVLLLITATALLPALKYVRLPATALLQGATLQFRSFKSIFTFVQLGIGLSLFTASMVVHRQINYSLVKTPGENHEQIITFPIANGLADNRADINNFHVVNPHFMGATSVSQVPTAVSSKSIDSDFFTIKVSPDFFDVLETNVVAGRTFRANDGPETYLVNGKGAADTVNANCIGVIENLSGRFNQQDKPLRIYKGDNQSTYFYCLRVLEVDIRQTMSWLHFVLERMAGHPVPISFIDKNFEAWLVYADRLNDLSRLLYLVAACVIALSMYGLALCHLRDNVMQLSIRKLYGATSGNLMRFVLRFFGETLLTTVLFCGPLVYFFLDNWLREFVYHTTIGWIDPLIALAFLSTIILLANRAAIQRFQKTNLIERLRQ